LSAYMEYTIIKDIIFFNIQTKETKTS
jgi:hypothetical protein